MYKHNPKTFTQIDNDILESKDLTQNETTVYIYLKKFANRENQCFPSLSVLAEQSKLSKRTVQRAINSLIEKKLISKSKRESNYSKIKTNLYTLYSLSDATENDKDENNKVEKPIQIANKQCKSKYVNNTGSSFDVNDLERLALMKYEKPNTDKKEEITGQTGKLQ